MGAVRDYFAAIGRTVLTLGDGMAVTFSCLLRSPVTIQYPDRIARPVTAMLPERSRGLLEFDSAICTACSLCERSCPIDCLHMETQKNEAGARMITRFEIEAGKCMYCGLCAEACPTGAIRHTREFEAAAGDVELLVLRFVDAPVAPIRPPKKGEPLPVGRPNGSILRKILPGPWDRPGAAR